MFHHRQEPSNQMQTVKNKKKMAADSFSFAQFNDLGLVVKVKKTDRGCFSRGVTPRDQMQTVKKKKLAADCFLAVFFSFAQLDDLGLVVKVKKTGRG
jgi:hypothetical protein